jgi:hypothetical protein
MVRGPANQHTQMRRTGLSSKGASRRPPGTRRSDVSGKRHGTLTGSRRITKPSSIKKLGRHEPKPRPKRPPGPTTPHDPGTQPGTGTATTPTTPTPTGTRPGTKTDIPIPTGGAGQGIADPRNYPPAGPTTPAGDSTRPGPGTATGPTTPTPPGTQPGTGTATTPTTPTPTGTRPGTGTATTPTTPVPPASPGESIAHPGIGPPGQDGTPPTPDRRSTVSESTCRACQKTCLMNEGIVPCTLGETKNRKLTYSSNLSAVTSEKTGKSWRLFSVHADKCENVVCRNWLGEECCRFNEWQTEDYVEWETTTTPDVISSYQPVPPDPLGPPPSGPSLRTEISLCNCGDLLGVMTLARAESTSYKDFDGKFETWVQLKCKLNKKQAFEQIEACGWGRQYAEFGKMDGKDWVEAIDKAIGQLKKLNIPRAGPK